MKSSPTFPMLSTKRSLKVIWYLRRFIGDFPSHWNLINKRYRPHHHRHEWWSSLSSFASQYLCLGNRASKHPSIQATTSSCRMMSVDKSRQECRVSEQLPLLDPSPDPLATAPPSDDAPLNLQCHHILPSLSAIVVVTSIIVSPAPPLILSLSLPPQPTSPFVCLLFFSDGSQHR